MIVTKIDIKTEELAVQNSLVLKVIEFPRDDYVVVEESHPAYDSLNYRVTEYYFKDIYRNGKLINRYAIKKEDQDKIKTLIGITEQELQNFYNKGFTQGVEQERIHFSSLNWYERLRYKKVKVSLDNVANVCYTLRGLLSKMLEKLK